MAAIVENGTLPKVKLYTNHVCPYAHRAHITLKELNIPYEEEIIDLDRPREPEYLKVNPRGLVPSIKYSDKDLNDEIITESAIVTQFLADAYPSHLLPALTAGTTASLRRARIQFLVDTWNSKLGSYSYKIFSAPSTEERESQAQEFLKTLEKEIEPLLHDASPYFGGSKQLTFAEAQIAPFVVRSYSLSKAGVIPAAISNTFDTLPNFSKWFSAVKNHPSVTYVYDEASIVERFKARAEKVRGASKV